MSKLDKLYNIIENSRKVRENREDKLCEMLRS